MAVDQRLARLHVDAPEIQLHALVRQRAAHQIVIPDRGAADGDEDIDFQGLRGDDGRLDIVQPVAANAQIDRHAAGSGDQAKHGVGIGRDDLIWPARGPRADQFVAGGEHAHARRPGEGKGRMVGAGGQRDVGRAQAPAFLQEDVAGPEIYAFAANIAARFDRRRRGDAIAVAARVFLNQHRICPLGHGRAGKDAHRLARTARTRKRPAGQDLPMTLSERPASAARRA